MGHPFIQVANLIFQYYENAVIEGQEPRFSVEYWPIYEGQPKIANKVLMTLITVVPRTQIPVLLTRHTLYLFITLVLIKVKMITQWCTNISGERCIDLMTTKSKKIV